MFSSPPSIILDDDPSTVVLGGDESFTAIASFDPIGSTRLLIQYFSTEKRLCC